MKLERVKPLTNEEFNRGPWFGFRILSAGTGLYSGGGLDIPYLVVDGGLPDYVLALYERRPESGCKWSSVRVVNSSTDSIIIALAQWEGEPLPPSAPLVANTFGDGAGKAVITDGLGAYAGISGGRLKVETDLSFNGDGAAQVTLVDTDGNGALSTEWSPSVYLLNVVPKAVVETIETGNLTAASGTGTTVDLSAYSALVLTCTGLNLSAGTMKLSIEGFDKVSSGTSLFKFTHTTGQATGAVSVQVGRGLTRTDLDARHATWGARPLAGRVAWDLTGGPPAGATGAYEWKGIRGEG